MLSAGHHVVVTMLPITWRLALVRVSQDHRLAVTKVVDNAIAKTPGALGANRWLSGPAGESRPAIRVRLYRLNRFGHAIEERLAQSGLRKLIALGRSEQLCTCVGMLRMLASHRAAEGYLAVNR